MWSILISTAVYIIAAFMASRYLDRELGWERGRSRSLVAGLIAFVVSSLVAWGIDAAFPSQAVNVSSLAGLAGVQAPGADPALESKAMQDAIGAALSGQAPPASPAAPSTPRP